MAHTLNMRQYPRLDQHKIPYKAIIKRGFILDSTRPVRFFIVQMPGGNLDGVGGLEPPNDRIKIYCLTNLAIPQLSNDVKHKLMNFGRERKKK